jgi:EAL domain-containing protein (putative c-di-GMP-specific phosphodiesterase class I)
MIADTLTERIFAPGGLTAMFQPIVNARADPAEVHSYECLTRGPKGTNLESSDVLFEYVRLKRMEPAVDRACFSTAIEAGSQIPGSPNLSINVHATTLATDRAFVDDVCRIAADAGVAASRLTVEIVEHSPAFDGKTFLDALVRFRKMGARIALDDVGLGQSNYKMVFDASPDYLKIDRFFISHCDAEPRRRAIIQSIAELAERFDAASIAEGVERPEELATLADHGVDLIQGYLFAKPLPLSFFLDREAAPTGPISDGSLALAWK